MSTNNNAEFRLMTFEKELATLLSDINLKSPTVGGQTDDQHQFQFKVRHVADDVIYLESVVPVARALIAGENIQILFGLADGLYLIKTKVDQANADQICVKLGKEVYRLQRRANFRTPIPSIYKIDFRVTSYKLAQVAKGIVLSLVDMSAGGIRARWPVHSLGQPSEGEHVSGVLVLPTGRQIELFGLVKTVMTDPAGAVQVGIEFQNVSVRDEQALLFVCMQIHREQRTVI